MSKNLKYACSKCRTNKAAKFVIVFPDPTSNKGVEIEVRKDWESKTEKNTDGTPKITKTRMLECGHFIPTHYPGFADITSENLSQEETAAIRKEIDKQMVNKMSKDWEKEILFQADQYQTLLKIHSKGKLSAKYAVQYIDQLRERSKYYLELDEKSKQNFDTAFYHFLDLKPTTPKTIEREKKRVTGAATTQRTSIESALDEMRAKVAKTGYDPKELLKAMLAAKTPAVPEVVPATVPESTTTNTTEVKEGESK